MSETPWVQRDRAWPDGHKFKALFEASRAGIQWTPDRDGAYPNEARWKSGASILAELARRGVTMTVEELNAFEAGHFGKPRVLCAPLALADCIDA